MKKNYFKILLGLTMMVSTLSFGQSKLIGTLSHMKDGVNEPWYMIDSTKIFYSAKGDIDSIHLIQPIDSLNTKWFINTSTHYKYTNNGDVVSRLTLTHDTIKNKYDTNERIVETYSNKKLLSRTQETYFKDKLRFSFADFYTYSNTGKIQKHEVKQWDTISNLWKITQNSTIDTFEYDNKDFLIAKSSMIWNYQKSKLDFSKKYVYTNNLSGYPVNILEQVWTSTNWYDMNNDSLVLNQSNEVIEDYFRYRHQGGMDKWGFQYKTTNTYLNNTSLLSKSITQKYDTIQSKFLTGTDSYQMEKFYDKDGNLTKYWEESYDTVSQKFNVYFEILNYYKNENVSSLVEKSLDLLHVYPNPAKDKITIQTKNELNKIDILNISGVKIEEIKDLNQNSIDISHLSTGIYFIQINNCHLIKFIKE